MKKILFPTDFSETADSAFRYTCELAEQLDARITVMAVYHLPLNDAGRVPPDYIQQMLQEKKQEVLKRIGKFSEAAPPDRLDEPRADYGLFIAQEISDAARKEGFDLIVMGTKGQHNPLEKILGSVTTQTMMKASCPVLAVPRDGAFHSIRRIAYATDFLPTDEQAVDQLMQFAGDLGASVHFVHIDTRKENWAEGEEFDLEDYPYDFTEFSVVQNNSAAEGMENYIRKKNIDLLALFIPHRRLWERLFHASFTKKMTFQTKLPLLVFHE